MLVGLDADCFAPEQTATEASLDELAALLEAAGGQCVGRVLQNRHTPDPHSFIGEGKAQEVRALAAQTGAEMLMFDNALSPSQLRALEELTGAVVLDRSALILDIFAQRAKTAEGRLQVELAQYQYLLPRLSGMGNACRVWAAASAPAAPARQSWRQTAATSASASTGCSGSLPRCAGPGRSSGSAG